MAIRGIACWMVLLCLSQLTAEAQTAYGSASSAGERLAALQKAHTEALVRIRKESTGFDAAKKAYEEALIRMSEEFKQTKDFDSLEACMAERQRFARDKSVPDSSSTRLPIRLREVQERFRQEALAAKRELQQRLVEKHRRYRIALLDLRQSAMASDDDDLAEKIGKAIEKTNILILEAEELLAKGRPSAVDAADRLPKGLERGLVLHYRFDERHGSQVMDDSGQDNHGTVYGARWSSLGRRKGAFWFDGVDDYIETPDAESLRTDRELTLSMCVFLQPDEGIAAGFSRHILSKSDAKGADYRLDISASHTLGAAVRHREKGNKRIRVYSDPARCKVVVKRWVHIVFVYDGRVAHTYVDGERDKTATAHGGIGATNTPLNIGRCGNGSWQFGFTGRMDDVLIWNRALSEAEVLGLWVSLRRSVKEPDSLGGGHCARQIVGLTASEKPEPKEAK